MNLEDLDSQAPRSLDGTGLQRWPSSFTFLKQPDLERVRSIGEFYADPGTRAFANLLIDLVAASGSCRLSGRIAGTGASPRVVRALQAHLEPYEVRIVPDHAPAV